MLFAVQLRFYFVGINVYLRFLSFSDLNLFKSFPLHSAGGSSTHCMSTANEDLAIGGDTRPDQSGVPAIFQFDSDHGKGLSRVPQPCFFCWTICIVAAIWYFTYFYSIFVVAGLSREPYQGLQLQLELSIFY